MDRWRDATPWIGLAARLLLGVVWIWASLSKLAHPLTFVQAVRAYDMTPEWLSKAVAYGLPVLELCLGLVLIVGIMVRIAAAVSGVLFLVFLVGLVQAAARGLKLDCGCFGGGGATDQSTSYTLDILRDVGLMVVAAYLVVWSMSQVSIEWYLARHDYVPPPSAKRLRTPEGRRRYEAQLATARATARSRTLYVDSSIALVVVLVSVIGIGVQANRAKITNVTAGTHASVAGGIPFGKKAAALVDVYEDFGCPVCLQVEQATSAKLQHDVRANLAEVRYHPISILDRVSPNDYSTRAANAAICVSDIGIEEFIAFHNLLYGKDKSGKQVQPAEGSAGPGDATLIELAKQAAPKLATTDITTLSDCVQTEKYKPLVQAMTDNSSKRGVTGTPTIYVNGSKLKDNSASTLFAAIAAADKKGPAPQPSFTPSPSPSSSGSGSASGSSSASPSASKSAKPSPSPSNSG
jgi:protein-disulfide isomerase